MKSIRNSIARKWFVKHIVGQLNVSDMPNDVLKNLATYKDEDVFELACEMIDRRASTLFLEYANIGIEDANEQEYDDFVSHFLGDKFREFNDMGDFIDFIIIKLTVILRLLMMTKSGDVKIDSSFDLWEVLERRDHLVFEGGKSSPPNECADTAPISTVKTVKSQKRTREKHAESCKSETSLYLRIRKAIEDKDYDLAKKLVADHRHIVDNLN